MSLECDIPNVTYHMAIGGGEEVTYSIAKQSLIFSNNCLVIQFTNSSSNIIQYSFISRGQAYTAAN